MKGKRVASLASDGLGWDHTGVSKAPPSLSSIHKGKVPSISSSMKGSRSATISTAKIAPRKRKGGVGLYGPWKLRHFGKGKLANLGKKVYG
jgi:hypothetical protein